MYEEIKKELKEILDIVKQCPENLQAKCFELLATPLISGSSLTSAKKDNPEKVMDSAVKPSGSFIIPIDVRAFLQQYSVSEEKLKKLFLLEGNTVVEIYSLSTTRRGTGQVQLSLLIALKSALEGNKFKFSIESVKQKCEEHKLYDSANFRKTFKDNKTLFKDLTDDSNIELTPDGKEKLAETILEIVK